MNTRDIGEPIVQIIQYLAQLVTFCFSFLDSITFLGTSLLDYFIAITILGAVFPIILSVVKSRSGGGSRRPSSKSDDE